MKNNNYEDVMKDIMEKEKAAGFAPEVEAELKNLGDPFNMNPNKGVLPTEVSTFLLNNDVDQLIIGIPKDRLLMFADNSLAIEKAIGYKEMHEREIMELLKDMDPFEFERTRVSYFPSSELAKTMKVGVKSIISIIIKESTLNLGRKETKNIVDIARQSTTFEVQKMLKHLNTDNLFNEFIPVPLKRYQATGNIEIFVNTSVVLLAYLGLTLSDIEGKYSFSVIEYPQKYHVELKRL